MDQESSSPLPFTCGWTSRKVTDNPRLLLNRRSEGVECAANEIVTDRLSQPTQGDVPIGFECVEEDLPIAGFHEVEIVAIVCDFQASGSLVGADMKVRNT